MRPTPLPPHATPGSDDTDAPLRRLLAALPAPARRGYEWLERPSRIWLRIPLSLLLIAGGFLGFLPILGFWMIPIGLVLLSQDVPALHRPTMRGLGAVQGWWDRLRARWGKRRDTGR